MADTIKASEYNSAATKINNLSKIEKKGTVSTISSVSVGAEAEASQIVLLQSAINKLESSFSNNCCQSVNNNCCQSCQKCQSCQRCQSCQGCQTQSCQSQSCQRCQSCQRQCNCDC